MLSGLGLGCGADEGGGDTKLTADGFVNLDGEGLGFGTSFLISCGVSLGMTSFRLIVLSISFFGASCLSFLAAR